MWRLRADAAVGSKESDAEVFLFDLTHLGVLLSMTSHVWYRVEQQQAVSGRRPTYDKPLAGTNMHASSSWGCDPAPLAGRRRGNTTHFNNQDQQHHSYMHNRGTNSSNAAKEDSSNEHYRAFSDAHVVP